MALAVSHLRRRFRRSGGLDERMRFYLTNRQIVSVRVVDSLSADAALQPIGSRYEHGFNVLLTRHAGHTRLRFTLAHEICHTFFYEFVPEIKFAPHPIDPFEERLCNLGAAELLMPAAAVERNASQRPICMQSLCELASEFSVSIAAMFVRLRTLRLWKCIFSEWHRMVNGTFVLANTYGGKRLPWEWDDPVILDEAWRSYKPSFGNAMIHYDGEDGGRYYFPARAQAQRLGNRVFSLWGTEVQNPSSPSDFSSGLSLAS